MQYICKIAAVTEHARVSHPSSGVFDGAGDKLPVVVLFSFVCTDFWLSVGLWRKGFINFFFKLNKRNGDDDGETGGKPVGDSALFKSKDFKYENFC